MNQDSNKTKSKPLTIFIVDDDRVTLMVSERLLQSYDANLQVCTFQSGANALEFFKSNKEVDSDIILLDINMPEYSGWDFLDDYTVLPSTCKVFMYSSSIDKNDLERSRTYAKVKGFIAKPLTSEKIKQFLADAFN